MLVIQSTMEFLSVISIFLIQAVAYVALQATTTCFLNRTRKFEQVERAESNAIFEYLSQPIPDKQIPCSADINERKPRFISLGKRTFQHALQHRGEQ